MTARLTALAAVAFTLLAAVTAACGDGDAEGPRVIIEPLGSPTAARPAVPGGEKLGSTQATRAAATATAPAPTPSPESPAPEDTPAPEPTLPPAPEPAATQPAAGGPPAVGGPPAAAPPASGRWIEVDVTNYVVRLMDGATALSEIAPVGVGARIDTGEYLSTQTGLFHVNSKAAGLVYDAPFDTYISHWVGFDADKDNGFHSFLKDAQGAVVDASTGRVSNGCIRTGAAEDIYAYAEIGMPVWVHW
jgi:hypothetical protein